MRKVVLQSLLLALVLSACNKDEVSYPYTYVSGEVTDGTLRLFTKAGEVNDPLVIKRFYNEMQKDIGSKAGQDTADELKVTYLNASDITIQNQGETHNGKAYKIGDVMIWEYPFKMHTYHMAPYLALWPITYEVFPTPVTSGYSEVIEYHPCIFAQLRKGQVYLPMIKRMLVSYFDKDSQPNVYVTQDNNIYDYSFHAEPDFYLADNDTLVVYEFSIQMKRQ